jgi:hypothetical protein
LGSLYRVPNAKKWYFWDLVPVLNVNLENFKFKNIIFHFKYRYYIRKVPHFRIWYPIQRPQEIEEKNSRKDFFWVFVPVQKPYFGAKKILKNSGAAFGTWYYLQKKKF